MLELRNRINNKNSRKYRMHEFIYKKKLQNPLKYTDSSNLNNKAIPIPKGTISIMLNTKKKMNLFAYQKKKKNETVLNSKSKFKIKWKTVQWLWINKESSVVSLLKHGRNIFMKFEENDECRLNKTEFEEMLSLGGLGGDHDLSEKLFM